MRCELCHTDNARRDGRCGPDCPLHASALLGEADMANVKARDAALEEVARMLDGSVNRHVKRWANEVRAMKRPTC